MLNLDIFQLVKYLFRKNASKLSEEKGGTPDWVLTWLRSLDYIARIIIYHLNSICCLLNTAQVTRRF